VHARILDRNKRLGKDAFAARALAATATDPMLTDRQFVN